MKPKLEPRRRKAIARWSVTTILIAAVITWCFWTIFRQSAQTSAVQVRSGETETTTSDFRNKLYVRGPTGNHGVIIFVHGFIGDPISTWTNPTTHAYWPALVAKDHLFDGWDIFTTKYDSRIAPFQGGPSIDQLVVPLHDQFTNNGVFEHRDIVFLSYSMGGLVTRALLTKFQNEEFVRQKVRFVYFFATPTTGTDIANFAQWLSPQVPGMRPLEFNEYLSSRMSDWLAARFPFPSYSAYELLDTLPGLKIVNEASAVALSTEPPRAVPSNHVTMVQPANNESDSYDAFAAAFRETILGHPTSFSSLRVSVIIRMTLETKPNLPDSFRLVAGLDLEDSQGEFGRGKDVPSKYQPLELESYWEADATRKKDTSGAGQVVPEGQAQYEVNVTHEFVPTRGQYFYSKELSQLTRIRIGLRPFQFHNLNSSEATASAAVSNVWRALSSGRLIIAGSFGNGETTLADTGFTESVWQPVPEEDRTNVRVEGNSLTQQFSNFGQFPAFRQ